MHLARFLSLADWNFLRCGRFYARIISGALPRALERPGLSRTPPAASAGAHPISLIAQLGPVSMSLGLRDLPLLEAVTAGLRRNGVPDLC